MIARILLFSVTLIIAVISLTFLAFYGVQRNWFAGSDDKALTDSLLSYAGKDKIPLRELGLGDWEYVCIIPSYGKPGEIVAKNLSLPAIVTDESERRLGKNFWGMTLVDGTGKLKNYTIYNDDVLKPIESLYYQKCLPYKEAEFEITPAQGGLQTITFQPED